MGGIAWVTPLPFPACPLGQTIRVGPPSSLSRGFLLGPCERPPLPDGGHSPTRIAFWHGTPSPSTRACATPPCGIAERGQMKRRKWGEEGRCGSAGGQKGEGGEYFPQHSLKDHQAKGNFGAPRRRLRPHHHMGGSGPRDTGSHTRRRFLPLFGGAMGANRQRRRMPWRRPSTILLILIVVFHRF